MSLEFRLLNFERKDGHFNTVVDKVIRDAVSEGKSPRTLLFTEWEPTVSLGKGQSYDDVNEDYCAKNRIHIVRRNSGGQAVHLDPGYIVFSIVAPTSEINGYIREYRELPINLARNALKKFGVNLDFHEPDNLVFNDKENGIMQTIGNSGQAFPLGEGTVMLHSSLRYEPANIKDLTSALRIKGEDISKHAEEISRYLGCIQDHNPYVKKEEIIGEIIREFERYFGSEVTSGKLNDYELEKIDLELARHKSPEHLKGYQNKESKGICYLFLNGKNIVPSLSRFFPYIEPSKPEDSQTSESYKLVEATA